MKRYADDLIKISFDLKLNKVYKNAGDHGFIEVVELFTH